MNFLVLVLDLFLHFLVLVLVLDFLVLVLDFFNFFDFPLRLRLRLPPDAAGRRPLSLGGTYACDAFRPSLAERKAAMMPIKEPVKWKFLPPADGQHLEEQLITLRLEPKMIDLE